MTRLPWTSPQLDPVSPVVDMAHALATCEGQSPITGRHICRSNANSGRASPSCRRPEPCWCSSGRLPVSQVLAASADRASTTNAEGPRQAPSWGIPTQGLDACRSPATVCEFVNVTRPHPAATESTVCGRRTIQAQRIQRSVTGRDGVSLRSRDHGPSDPAIGVAPRFRSIPLAIGLAEHLDGPDVD